MTDWNRQAFTRNVLSHPAAVRVDVDGSLMYVGMATCGTGESDPHWQIKQVVVGTDGDVTVTWADGDDKFDNVWANRTVLAYV